MLKLSKQICLLLFFICLQSCFSVGYEIEEKTLCPINPPIKKIAVMPFLIPLGNSSDSYLGQEMGLVREGKIEENAAEKMTNFVEDVLKEFGCFEIVTWEEIVNIYQQEQRDLSLYWETKDIKNLIKNIGAKTGADTVLVGYVTKYADRHGTAYSVSRPASVSFALFLISTKDGAIIWRASYRETQTSLSENLFNIKLFFKRGLKWLTADELAKWGVAETMKNFPGRYK